jgi:hypothetical protein
MTYQYSVAGGKWAFSDYAPYFDMIRAHPLCLPVMPSEHDMIYIGDDHKLHGNDMPGFMMVGPARAVCVGTKLPRILTAEVLDNSSATSSSATSRSATNSAATTRGGEKSGEKSGEESGEESGEKSDEESGQMMDAGGSWLVLNGQKVAGVPMYEGGPAAVRDVLQSHVLRKIGGMVLTSVAPRRRASWCPTLFGTFNSAKVSTGEKENEREREKEKKKGLGGGSETRD